MAEKITRIYIFIDVANVWSAQKSKRHLMDYTKIKSFIETKFAGTVRAVFYYEAYPKNETREYSTDGTHKFMTFLEKKLGFTIRKKPLKQIHTESGTQEKGNMDVEITIDAIHQKNKYDRAVFFTGDSDFLQLISYLRHGGKKVYIFSSENNISTELRTGADGYFDLLKITDIWGAPLKYRFQKK